MTQNEFLYWLKGMLDTKERGLHELSPEELTMVQEEFYELFRSTTFPPSGPLCLGDLPKIKVDNGN